MAHTHYRTKGIVLKKEDRSEADQLFTIFSEDFGRLEVLGRAIRKITSKLRSGIEPFYLSEIEFIQGKNYKTLTDAIMVDKFERLRKDPERLEVGYRMAEAVDILTGREDKDPRLWDILQKAFVKLNEDSSKPELVFQHFFWNLLRVVGYKPELKNCAHCHDKLLPETLFFSPEQGGVICWQCLKEVKNGEEKEIVLDSIKLMRLFLKEPLDVTDKVRVEDVALKNLKEISETYLNHFKP